METQPPEFRALSPKSRQSGKIWSKEQLSFLFKHRYRPTDWLAEQLGRTEPAVKSQLYFQGWSKGKGYEGNNSVVDFVYYGPEGWDESMGPPCLHCKFDNSKINATHTQQAIFRRECNCCEARLRWDAYNGGPERQRQDYCEGWPEAPEGDDD